MMVFENSDYLFYAAGKTGTRTLYTIPDIVDVTVHEEFYSPLRERSLMCLDERKELTGKQIVAIIREPWSRMYSGLYEIIVKIVAGPFIEEMIEQNADVSFIENTSIWSRMFERCIKMSPRQWIPDQEMDSHRWQFHIGNWLTDIEMLAEKYPDTIILDLSDLSRFLDENSIKYEHKNKMTDFLGDETLSKNCFEAFKCAIANSGYQRRKQIFDYLLSEVDCYKRLNSKRYYGMT